MVHFSSLNLGCLHPCLQRFCSSPSSSPQAPLQLCCPASAKPLLLYSKLQTGNWRSEMSQTLVQTSRILLLGERNRNKAKIVEME